MEGFIKKNLPYILIGAMIIVALLGPAISTIAVYVLMLGMCILAGYGAMKAFESPVYGAIGLMISGVFIIVTNYFGWYDWIFQFAWMMGSFAQGLSSLTITIAVIALAILGGKAFFSNLKIK